MATSEDTYIFKTNFNYKTIVGSRYELIYIGLDNKAVTHNLVFKCIKYNKTKTEKSYEFAVDDGSPYPQNYIQITTGSKSDYDVYITMQTDIAQFIFYCRKAL